MNAEDFVGDLCNAQIHHNAGECKRICAADPSMLNQEIKQTFVKL
jgi:hypothetical protein